MTMVKDNCHACVLLAVSHTSVPSCARNRLTSRLVVLAYALSVKIWVDSALYAGARLLL